MSNLLGASTRFRRLLVVVGLVAACATACVAVVPAFATNEGYHCKVEPCAETNGPENYVTNNEGINYSGTGSCSAVWRFNGGKNYTLMADGCAGG